MRPIVFYDGSCALCHGFVRWVVERDRTGVFDFAPLRGKTFRDLISTPAEAQLPDSVIVRDEEGRLHTHSTAIAFVLRKLGRRRSAWMIELFPRLLRDATYSTIARARYSIFGRKTELCPIVPAELRHRFLD